MRHNAKDTICNPELLVPGDNPGVLRQRLHIPNAYQYTDAYTHAYSHCHQYANAHSHTDAYCHQYSDSYLYGYANSHQHTDAYIHTYPYAYQHADAHSYTYPYRHQHADAYFHADADCHQHTDADSHAIPRSRYPGSALRLYERRYLEEETELEKRRAIAFLVWRWSGPFRAG